MGTYTDWGNLQIVSCVAWLNGAGPGSSTVVRGMDALGASISWLSKQGAGPQGLRRTSGRGQLGDAENIR